MFSYLCKLNKLVHVAIFAKVILKSLQLFNFRNYADQAFSFRDGANALTGLNGVGKTNVLDAIHYLCLGKSYFHSGDSYAIHHGSTFFTLNGLFELEGLEEDIIVSVKSGQKKTIRRNGKEYSRLGDHIGLLPVVMVAPVDQELITGGSEERRRMMDAIICQYDHAYLEHLMAYNRMLQQRNAMLKQAARSRQNDHLLWEVWDEQLCGFAGLVHRGRIEFMQRFQPLFRQLYSKLTGEKELANIRYQSALERHTMEDLLAINRSRDLALEYTSAGIHKDDLHIELNNHPLRKVGSQGQQKSVLLALKLAQFKTIQDARTMKPLLLLDDIFDKLDLSRITRLMEMVSEDNFGQLFLTDTNDLHVRQVFRDIGVDLNVLPCS